MTAYSALNRRRILSGSVALGGVHLLGGCATTAPSLAPVQRPGIVLPPIRAQVNRIFDITVCTRPFRAAGPRLDTEQVGDTLVVHNYGHGGSGWSLSWGSGTIAVRKAMASSPREVAVIGCGVLGLTSALLAQQAGAQVTIYARDLLPDTRSARATGSWTPDSRIALADAVAPDFPALWEQMARTSFHTFRRYLGLPGDPIEWVDRYIVSEPGPALPRPSAAGALEFAQYVPRIRDITPISDTLPAGATSFPAGANVRRQAQMIFNIANYGHTLMADFLAAGGKIRRMEFHTPADIAALPEKVVINCPGYGARALWRDETVTPVRGQLAWLIPQREVNYALFYDGVSVVPRRDGICVQATSGGDMAGYGDDSEIPDRTEAEASVKTLAGLMDRMRIF